MKDKSCFFDTNLLIYLYSIDNKQKRNSLLLILNKREQLFISRQVVNEMCNVLSRKFNMPAKKIINVINEFENVFSVFELTGSTTIKALRIQEKYKYSFWDSMILASALDSNCDILYSEDMQDGQLIDNKLKIINPFKKT